MGKGYSQGWVATSHERSTPMPQAVTIESLPEAFEVIKEMQAEGYTWGEDYRPTSRAALARILEDGMAVSLDRHLREMARRGEADRRNGAYNST